MPAPSTPQPAAGPSRRLDLRRTMPASRRDVLRWIALTAGAAMTAGGVMGATRRLAFALAAQPGAAPLVWLTAGGDDLHLLAQLGRRYPTLLEQVFVHWNVASYDALLPAGAEPAGAASSGTPGGAPIVIVESLPDPAETGAWDALAAWVKRAKTVICVGTEAAYGGTATPSDTARRFTRLCRAEKSPLIKLPGIPPPPHHLIGTLAHLQWVGFPRLDAEYRPELYYSDTVCVTCERRGDLEAGRFAASLGGTGCLLRLGCKGPVTHNTCSAARWNGGVNWCVGAGGPCTGCAEPGFPDHGGLGLYGRIPGDALAARSLVLENLDLGGKALLALTALGIGLHIARRRLERRAGRRADRSTPAEPPPPRRAGAEGHGRGRATQERGS